ncbi:hypothetical protein Q7C36_002650 [Tachysurus vachellii]|uniref:Uncharacterized protein n=1 Tax=Tachysurus vachellii TaxID=175792 RepID=A0AA88NYJ0_TACVA|nr:hypothetical protein Q7C36_002650 [Tachysurus vachellii]
MEEKKDGKGCFRRRCKFTHNIEGLWARWWCCCWKFPQRLTSCPSALMNLASPCSLKHHALSHWLPSQGFNQEVSMIRL